MNAEPAGGLRGFFRSTVGRIALILLTLGAVFGTFSYVPSGAILAIPLFLVLGLLLPIWVGLKRGRYLALAGLVVLLAVAPLTNLVVTQEVRTPAPPVSSTATVPSAGGPVALVVNDTREVAYVADYAADTVHAINLSTDAVTATIAVGALPFALALSPTGRDLYAADLGGNSVSIVNLTTGAVQATLAVGKSPDALGVDPAQGKVFVANLGSANVSVISTGTERLTGAVAAGDRPDSVVFDPASNQTYVANRGSGTVTAIFAKNDTVAATILVGSEPGALSVNPNGSLVVVANAGSANVSLISTATDKVVGTVAVGADPIAVAMAAGAQAYVSAFNSSSVDVVSLLGLGWVRTISLPGGPGALAVDSSSGEIYAAEVPNGTVVAISPSNWSVFANVTVGSQPAAIAVDPGAGVAVVAAYGAQSVVVFRTSDHSVLSTIADRRNGAVLQNISVTPFTGAKGTVFVFTLSLYPWFVPQGTAAILSLHLYLSTCPGATTANTSGCGSGYGFSAWSVPFAEAPSQVTNLSLPFAGLADGIWSWTAELTLSGLLVVPSLLPTANTTLAFAPANATGTVLEGPVVGSFAVTYGEILPEIYLTTFVYLGIPFYFALILYLWFKSREARHKEAIRRAAKAMAAAPAAPGAPAPSGPPAGPPPSEGAPPSELACPSCGAVVYPNEAKCWKCGSDLAKGGGGTPLASKN